MKIMQSNPYYHPPKATDPLVVHHHLTQDRETKCNRFDLLRSVAPRLAQLRLGCRIPAPQILMSVAASAHCQGAWRFPEDESDEDP